MRPDHRRLRDFQCLVYGPFGAVSEIDQDAEPIALDNDLSSEISQAVVLGRFRLEVSDRVPGVMHQLNVPNAEFIGCLYARNIVLQEKAALRRQDDMRNTRKRRHHVVPGLDRLELLLDDMLLDARQIPFEPRKALSRHWHGLLHIFPWAQRDPRRIGAQRPGHQSSLVISYDLPHGPRLTALQSAKPQVTMHVAKVYRLFGPCLICDP